MTLEKLPESFASTREAVHQLAFFALSPARHKVAGRMALKDTPGGFGTPEYDGQVARVEGDLLVFEKGDHVATQTISTIRAAAEFFGNAYEAEWFPDFHDPLAPADPDAPLDVDPEAVRALGNWFEFAFDVLNQMRGHGVEGDDVTEVQLWPEHFDPATELGDYEKGQRASFGASPGDGAHPEPYLYVASWSEIDRSNPFWNNDSFNGGSIGYAELAAADDPVQAAVGFYLEGYRVLHSD
jgi:hypothetical protein